MSEHILPRQHLVRSLRADLVGPFRPAEDGQPDTFVETLELPPSRWYLTGFLVPAEGEAWDEVPTEDEELAAGSDEDDEETTGSEPEPRQKKRLPSSLGMSVLLPPGETTDTIQVTLRYADYHPIEVEQEGKKRKKKHWQRDPRPAVQIELPLDPAVVSAGITREGTGGLWIGGKLGTAEAPGLAKGTRALSLFVVNRRQPGEKGSHDSQYIFQVQLELGYAGGFVARPDQRDELSDEWDSRVADLQFRGRCEHAVGHGVSVEVPPSQNPVTIVRTTWLPSCEVPLVVTREIAGVNTRMADLGSLANGQVARTTLLPLIDAYRAWIATQASADVGSTGRTETRDALVERANQACKRIEAGIELLATDPEVLEAFCLANQAMHEAALKRFGPDSAPSWRLFQLAYVLMSLPGIADPRSPDRDIVDLIFFPTGGGKTEAYLGVIAFTLLLRRLRGQERPDHGLGVAVILRYTLRLLTLDQLGRAATLICALDLLRQKIPDKLGSERFAAGLWVGRSATANTIKDVSQAITEYKNNPSAKAGSPFPLTHCPWCGAKLDSNSLELKPSKSKPERVVVACTARDCEFTAARNPDGLPVVFVDEQVYRELPCFILATVDKFAMLPWRGETGMLFGRAFARQGNELYGPLDSVPPNATRVPDGLLPPELIVQDELHLISGPLGTMVGLFETVIEALCLRQHDGVGLRPKILASTATVKRAAQQVRALFGRNDLAVFPPPGIEDNETFFAEVDRDNPGRLYLGVAAPGRSMKSVSAKVYSALLAAAQHAYDPKGAADQSADAYTTLVGYFGSLRELGGTRRLVEDQVRTLTSMAEQRRPLDHAGPHPWFKNRTIHFEPVELTSRESTGRIKESRARLAKPYCDKERVDVLLASNMISVGLDIDRLGLMVVCGQPKTTSEYIQATSRVGRDRRWPGLVVTTHNLFRPRDRSHYEHFVAYHQSFYRHVESMSLTPYSGPALERGLAGALVALTRLLDPDLTRPESAMALEHKPEEFRKRIAKIIAARAQGQPSVSASGLDQLSAELAQRCNNLFDAWLCIIERAKEGAGSRCYSRFDREHPGKPLLYMVIDEELPTPGTDDHKFAAPTSMRDVELNVHLWMDRQKLGRRSNDA